MNTLRGVKASAFASTLVILSLTAPVTSAEKTWSDLSVHNGPTLQRSLIAMNVQLQQRYANEDYLLSLSTPRASDFATTAVLTASVPDITAPETTAVALAIAYQDWGTAITDGASLNSQLQVLNYALATRGNDLFLQIAAAANAKRHTFANVAEAVDQYNAIEQYQYALLDNKQAFGDSVQDGRSLERHLVQLNQFIGEATLREALLAGAVPAITGDSFDQYAVQLHVMR